MSAKEGTEERILRAFLDMIGERGYEGTTTRAVAEAAGVNEVTLFRHFGDKETLAREAFIRLGPAPRLAGYEPHIDTSDPARAAAGLQACLAFLRNTLLEHPVFLNPSLRTAWRRSGRDVEKAMLPRAALALIHRALEQAAPALRAEVDRDATAFSLLGLVILPALWQGHGWLVQEHGDGDELLAAGLRPLIDWEARIPAPGDQR